MSAIIPFANGGQVPAYLKNKAALAAINKDVVGAGPSFPTLSIKGKVFTIVKGGERKTLMRPDDEDEVLQNINLAVLRANTKARVFYAKAYSEEDSDGAIPTCRSDDGVAPADDVEEKQSKKCAVCPQAVWGTGRPGADGQPGRGTACAPVARLAVADPDKLDAPLLLRVPVGSRKFFAEAVKKAEQRGIPYNALVMKVGFDPAAVFSLTFKPVGLLDDTAYEKATALYDSEIVHEIVGLASPTPAAQPAEPEGVDMSELDAAIQAKAAVTQAKAAPKASAAAAQAKPKAEPKPAAAVTADEIEDVVAKPVVAAKVTVREPEPAKPAAAAGGMDDLLGDLDALLGATDD